MFAEQVAWAPAVWAAFLSLLLVTTEYMVLVPLKKNRSAKRLAFFMIVCTALAGVTLARIYLGDWNGRYEIISTMFVGLTICVLYLGWNIWRDQRAGAIRSRNQSKEYS